VISQPARTTAVRSAPSIINAEMMPILATLHSMSASVALPLLALTQLPSAETESAWAALMTDNV
jgi:hypothetical protein